jgi:hypothetical protein
VREHLNALIDIQMKGLIPGEIIERKIFLLRGQKVMLSNHIERFPEDFMFTLTRQEIINLSQFVISSRLKHAPNVYAFTEQGVAMLSSVLRSKRAIRVNITIMRTFIKLRGLLLTHKDLAIKLEALEKKYVEHDEKIQAIFQVIKQLLELPPEVPKRKIGFHI